MALEYTSHYTITNLDLIGSDYWAQHGLIGTGVILATNTHDIVLDGAQIDGFYVGVNDSKTFTNGVNDPRHFFIDVVIWNAGEE